MPRQYDYTQSQMDQYSTLPPVALKQSTNLSRGIPNTDKFQQDKQSKLQSLRQKMQEEQMQQCTFRPKTNQRAPSRNLQEFLSSQQQHLDNVHRKKAVLQLKLEEQALRYTTFSPRINKSSTCHPHPEIRKPQQEVHSHTPKICQKSAKLKRSKPVGQLLYQDAQRRNQRQSQPQEVLFHSKSTTNNKYAASKFVKEYLSTLQLLHIDPTNKLPYDAFNEVLKALGYVRYSQVNNPTAIEQKSLLHQLYQYLFDCHYLCIFLLAINGIFDIELQDLLITEQEGRKIQHHFDLLYRNRLTFIRPKKESNENEKCKMSKVSQETEVLAEKYRSKMVSRINEVFEKNQVGVILPHQEELNHQDLLVIHSIGRSMELENIRQKKNSSVDPECTFKPMLSSHNRTNNAQPNTFNQTLQSNRSNKCNNNGNALQSNRSNRCNIMQSTSKIQKSSNKNTLTLLSPRNQIINFQKLSSKSIQMPKQSVKKQMKQSKIVPRSTNSVRNVKDTDKAILRMRQARQMKQKKQQYLNRGQPLTDRTKQSKKKEENKQKTPFLVVDINIEEEISHLYFYPGDQLRIDQIVEQFCNQKDLEQQNKTLIIEMVHQQIAQVMK